jgi:hypothetical protein
MLKIPSPLASQPLPTLALLAGGLATRLGPLTRATPKSLLPVAGQPFLAHQLRSLVSQGVRDIGLCCGHLGEQIEATIGDGSAYNCRIRYSFDNHPAPGVTSPTLLGTGGALHKALPLLGPAFFVLYGDSYLLVALHPIYEAGSTRSVISWALLSGPPVPPAGIFEAGLDCRIQRSAAAWLLRSEQQAVRCGLPVIQEEWLRTPHKIRLPKCSVSQLSLPEHFAEVNDALLRGGALC